MLRIVIAVILFVSIQANAAEHSQIGKYQIVVTSPASQQVYLLDTSTGKVWQLVHFDELYGDPQAWQEMDKIDEKSLGTWFSHHATKKQVEESEAAQKAQAQKYIDQNLKP